MAKKKQRRRQRRAGRPTSPPATIAAEPARPAPAPAPALGPPPRDRHRRRAVPLWPITAAVALLGLGAIGSAYMLARPAQELATTPVPSVVVGVPDGEVIPGPTEPPSPSPAQATTPVPTPTASPAPPAPESPTSTAGPVAVATAPPPPPPATPAPTAPPEPPTVVLAAVGPDDTVAAFYGRVVDGLFDEAYDLWSASMKAAYPRQSNLDDRFDETASIEFHELFVAEQSATGATVQANFVETSDSGSSREFVGFWRLVLVDGRWLLDEPHY